MPHSDLNWTGLWIAKGYENKNLRVRFRIAATTFKEAHALMEQRVFELGKGKLLWKLEKGREQILVA